MRAGAVLLSIAALSLVESVRPTVPAPFRAPPKSVDALTLPPTCKEGSSVRDSCQCVTAADAALFPPAVIHVSGMLQAAAPVHRLVK